MTLTLSKKDHPPEGDVARIVCLSAQRGGGYAADGEVEVESEKVFGESKRRVVV